MRIVAWSRDGRFLYAAGRYHVSDWFPIRRWEAGGKGAFVEWRVGTNYGDCLQAPADGSCWGPIDPLVAVLDARGEVRWRQRGATG